MLQKEKSGTWKSQTPLGFWSDLYTYTHYIYKIQVFFLPCNPTLHQAIQQHYGIIPHFTWSYSLILQHQPSSSNLRLKIELILSHKICSPASENKYFTGTELFPYCFHIIIIPMEILKMGNREINF